ncbi:MAG: HAD-IA family hydrolase [Bacteroidota bacterium]
MNILVASGGGFQGLAIVKELSAIDFVNVFVADTYAENVTKYFSHKSFKVLPVADPGFIPSLLKLCLAEDIRLIIPSTNHELALLSGAREQFSKKNIFIAISSLSILKIFLDKKLFYEFLSENNQPVLPVLDVQSSTIAFPVIGKPRGGWGGTEILKIHDKAGFENLDDRHRNDFVWQQCLLDFEEISIDFAIGFDRKISIPNCRKRIRTSGGFAVVMDTYFDPKLLALFDQFASLISGLGATGLFNMQVLIQGSDYYISDINPRMGTSSVMWKVNNNNLSRFLIASLPLETHKSPAGESKIQLQGTHKIVRYIEEICIPEIDLSKIKCLVFDLDDTLLPQKKWMFLKLKLVYEKHRIILPGRNAFLEKAMSLIEEGHRKLLIDELINEFKIDPALRDDLIASYRQACPAEDITFPEVYFVLCELKRKYGLVLLSDNPLSSQKQKISATKLEVYFDHVIYTDELGVSKPDPKTFLEVAKRCKYDVSELAMVGDNLYRDIAGSLKCGYAYGFYLRQHKAMFNFDDIIFRELTGDNMRTTPIENLKQLLWYL